jgi:uncharacterized protein
LGKTLSILMETNPVVKAITIYPVKSLDGISLQKAQIGNGGSLVHDREFAICKSDGKYVKGKNNDLVYLLRSAIDFENEIISFRHQSESGWHQFHLQNDKKQIDEYLSSFFNLEVTLQKNSEGKFLDEPVISGITIVSTESLNMVSGWFNDMPLEETRKRFRANIQIAAATAFWEDQLFFEQGTAIEFKIGEITLYGMSPRARCVVPSRHPQTGEAIHGFQKTFAQQRVNTLPQWSTLELYSHAYYLSVDCYIPPTEFGKWIAVGDELAITGKKTLPTFTQ